jgi:hypothetical protein
LQKSSYKEAVDENSRLYMEKMNEEEFRKYLKRRVKKPSLVDGNIRKYQELT